MALIRSNPKENTLNEAPSLNPLRGVERQQRSASLSTPRPAPGQWRAHAGMTGASSSNSPPPPPDHPPGQSRHDSVSTPTEDTASRAPSGTQGRYLQQPHVQSLEDLWAVKLGVGGSDGGLQNSSQVVLVQSRSRTGKLWPSQIFIKVRECYLNSQ